MRSAAPRHWPVSSWPLLSCLILLAAAPLHAATFLVTNEATLDAAISAATLNNDPDNFIYVTVSPLYTNGPVKLVPDVNNIAIHFNDGHRLMFRSMLTTSPRAEIIDLNPDGDVLTVNNEGGVTIQNLDFLRDITTLHGLMSMSICRNVTFERCRLGYVNASKGSAGLHLLEIQYPTNVVIRNCDFFSVFPGAFDEDIHILAMTDPDNSLLLYNNDVSGYGTIGIRSDGGMAGALLVLRNNVVENSPAIAPEPTAFSSGVPQDMRVRTSHNSVFASAGFAEALDLNAQSIAGTVGPDFLQLFPSVSVETGAFITQTWDATPGAVNATFDHLVATGSLHDPSNPGVTVLNGWPDLTDVAVIDDFDHEPRPSVGAGPHTDRGLDQVDPGSSAASVPTPGATSGLWAAPRRNPSSTLDLAIESSEGGALSVGMFDLGGRQLWSASREIADGAALIWSAPASRAAGVVFYRVRLVSRSGAVRETHGRMVLVH
jgi:hypothetical protein